jgi:general secretion pathway protein G
MRLNTLQTARRRATRRTAFTLLEVLIVVAILVILAGSASIAVFKYLDDAKKGRAKADMMAIEKAIKTVYMENQGQQWPDMSQSAAVASKLEQGQAGLISPWGQPYQWEVGQDAQGNERVMIHCTTNKGEQIRWPER